MTRRNVAVKVEEGVHHQLGLLAQLAGDGTTIPDVIRQAVDEHLARKRTELAERADEVVAGIEREAAAKRAAMESLFGNGNGGAAPEAEAESGKARTAKRPEAAPARQAG